MGGQGGQGGWVLCCIVFLFCNFFVPADRCRPALFGLFVCACFAFLLVFSFLCRWLADVINVAGLFQKEKNQK